MDNQKIDGKLLRDMFVNGARNLEINKKVVDDLNVFPVPDGDTGTNMFMTINSAINELNRLDNNQLYSVGKTVSSGALMGARGNSGVILSQLLRGLAQGMKEKGTIETPEDLANILVSASNQAYKAVMQPTEGTILTVAREMGEFAENHKDEYKDKSLQDFFKDVLAAGNDALKRTPEMLPVLKEAGVVDSGGQGLMFIMEGLYKAFSGEELVKSTPTQMSSRERFVDDSHMKPEDITFGYCTEFIVKDAEQANEEDLKEYLSTIGDCVLVIKDDDIIKVHVHTDHPGKAFEKGLEYGPLTRMKVDNMHEMVGEVEDAVIVEDEAVPYGFIAVSPGEGITKVFKDIGIQHVITGGQTMNPSTHDFLSIIDQINADCIYLFPNNSNILLAANQAKAISEKNITVIPSKTVPQCIAAMLAFNPENSQEENTDEMEEALTTIESGEVTYAVRDTKVDGLKIKKNHIIGITGGKIIATSKSVDHVVEKMLEEMLTEDSTFVSLYYGHDTTEKDSEKLEEKLIEKFPEISVESVWGGQPLYYYILSVE